jgi:hypothetical protein
MQLALHGAEGLARHPSARSDEQRRERLRSDDAVNAEAFCTLERPHCAPRQPPEVTVHFDSCAMVAQRVLDRPPDLSGRPKLHERYVQRQPGSNRCGTHSSRCSDSFAREGCANVKQFTIYGKNSFWIASESFRLRRNTGVTILMSNAG